MPPDTWGKRNPSSGIRGSLDDPTHAQNKPVLIMKGLVVRDNFAWSVFGVRILSF